MAFPLAALLVVAGLSGACRPAPDYNLLLQAQALGEERQWLEARALLKEYLRQHPQDVAGHFLLGRSFLHLPDNAANETIARGELLTAYALYNRTGQRGILAEQEEQEFRAFFHLLMATSYLRSARRAINAGALGEELVLDLQASLQHVRQGLEHDPESAFLQEMLETITPMLEELRGYGPRPPGPPEPLRRAPSWI